MFALCGATTLGVLALGGVLARAQTAASVAPLRLPVIVSTELIVPVNVNDLPFASVNVNVMLDPFSVPDSAVMVAAIPIVPPASPDRSTGACRPVGSSTSTAACSATQGRFVARR